MKVDIRRGKPVVDNRLKKIAALPVLMQNHHDNCKCGHNHEHTNQHEHCCGHHHEEVEHNADNK